MGTDYTTAQILVRRRALEYKHRERKPSEKRKSFDKDLLCNHLHLFIIDLSWFRWGIKMDHIR